MFKRTVLFSTRLFREGLTPSFGVFVAHYFLVIFAGKRISLWLDAEHKLLEIVYRLLEVKTRQCFFLILLLPFSWTNKLNVRIFVVHFPSALFSFG